MTIFYLAKKAISSYKDCISDEVSNINGLKGTSTWIKKTNKNQMSKLYKNYS